MTVRCDRKNLAAARVVVSTRHHKFAGVPAHPDAHFQGLSWLGEQGTDSPCCKPLKLSASLVKCVVTSSGSMHSYTFQAEFKHLTQSHSWPLKPTKRSRINGYRARSQQSQGKSSILMKINVLGTNFTGAAGTIVIEC